MRLSARAYLFASAMLLSSSTPAVANEKPAPDVLQVLAETAGHADIGWEIPTPIVVTPALPNPLGLSFDDPESTLNHVWRLLNEDTEGSVAKLQGSLDEWAAYVTSNPVDAATDLPNCSLITQGIARYDTTLSGVEEYGATTVRSNCPPYRQPQISGFVGITDFGVAGLSSPHSATNSGSGTASLLTPFVVETSQLVPLYDPPSDYHAVGSRITWHFLATLKLSNPPAYAFVCLRAEATYPAPPSTTRPCSPYTGAAI